MSAVEATTLRRLPKVELHVHLEGTMPAATIAALADEVGEPLPRPVDQLFSADGLSDFLGFLDWSCGLVRSPEAAAAVAYEHATRSALDGIRYAEIIVNPTHWPRLPLEDLVGGIADGFARAAADGHADCHLLLSILRTQSAAEAEALARWMTEHRPPRVVGLSVDGNEQRAGRTSERFRRAYDIARDGGFGLTAHAGESSGPEGVVDALDVLRVDRIDHGVRAAEDPDLLRRLADQGTTLNVCLTSNSYLLYPGLEHHPLPTLVAHGVPVTINTDDPAFLGCDLTGELAIAASMTGWDLTELADVTRVAIAASFAPADVKAELRAAVDGFAASSAVPINGSHPGAPA